jgi:hypothetical protein
MIENMVGTRRLELLTSTVSSDKCQMEESTKLKARRKAQEGR